MQAGPSASVEGARPLAGIRVADFTLHAAGPYCTHFLTLLGAEVIKVESSMRLDINRRPHPVYGRTSLSELDQANVNKLSITLNLKEPRGVELAKRLVSKSDVMAESFRPGVTERLGIDYKSLSGVKPDIVMVSISASGQTGPESRQPGYAPLFAALGGLSYLTGYADGPPVEMRNIMDNVTGLTGALAVVAALHRRAATGEGAYLDVAAREVASMFVGDALLVSSMGGEPPKRSSNDQAHLVPNGVYRCAGRDRWVTISVSSEQEWRSLARACDRPDWLEDARFQDQLLRWDHRGEIDAELEKWTRKHSASKVTEILQSVGVPAFPSFNAADMVADDHLAFRRTITTQVGPRGVARPVVGAPWLFDRSTLGFERWTPDLGEHNEYVLQNLLELPKSEMAELIKANVIA